MLCQPAYIDSELLLQRRGEAKGQREGLVQWTGPVEAYGFEQSSEKLQGITKHVFSCFTFCSWKRRALRKLFSPLTEQWQASLWCRAATRKIRWWNQSDPKTDTERGQRMWSMRVTLHSPLLLPGEKNRARQTNRQGRARRDNGKQKDRKKGWKKNESLVGIKGLQRCKVGEARLMRKGRADGCKEHRVMEEGWTESTQTGDVGGNNVGVRCYLYLQKCRWARGKYCLLVPSILFYIISWQKGRWTALRNGNPV